MDKPYSSNELSSECSPLLNSTAASVVYYSSSSPDLLSFISSACPAAATHLLSVLAEGPALPPQLENLFHSFGKNTTRHIGKPAFARTHQRELVYAVILDRLHKPFHFRIVPHTARMVFGREQLRKSEIDNLFLFSAGRVTGAGAGDCSDSSGSFFSISACPAARCSSMSFSIRSADTFVSPGPQREHPRRTAQGCSLGKEQEHPPGQHRTNQAGDFSPDSRSIFHLTFVTSFFNFMNVAQILY